LARLAEIAAAQVRIARLQRIARRMLGAKAIALVVGLGFVWRLLKTNLEIEASLKAGEVNLLTEAAAVEQLHDKFDGALRLAIWAAHRELDLDRQASTASPAGAALADAVSQSHAPWMSPPARRSRSCPIRTGCGARHALVDVQGNCSVIGTSGRAGQHTGRRS
jgi:hypothetical protein